MEILNDVNTYLSVKHKDGSVPNEIIFLYARSGYGKTLAMESIIEEYYRAGFVVLCLSDVKDKFEFGYAMFEPKRPYHLYRLKKDGKPIKTYPTKLYHPFTFNIPKEKLPEINFYGFSLKDLRRPEWSMICESESESDPIRILLNASNTIGNDVGLYRFLHSIEENIIGKKDEGRIRRDPKIFNLRTTGGTSKSLQDVASYFLPFQKHLFLVPDNSPLKLDWKSILNDNEHYHVFGTRWIDDEKLKEFTILCLLNQIIRSRDNTSKPCLIVIPEIRYLLPERPKGYKIFLSQGISKTLAIMRSKGEGGNSGLFDSQSWSEVEQSTRNSGTNKTFYGEISGGKDIENITKATRMRPEVRNHLNKAEIDHTYYGKGIEDRGSWMFWLPGHMHSEEEYDLFKIYNQHFPDKMKNYGDLVSNIKKSYLDEKNITDERLKKQAKQEREEREKKKLERQKNQEGKNIVDERIEKIKEKETQSKEKILERERIEAYNFYYNNPEESMRKSYRKVGEYLNIDNKTAKKRIEEQEQVLRKESLKVNGGQSEKEEKFEEFKIKAKKNARKRFDDMTEEERTDYANAKAETEFKENED